MKLANVIGFAMMLLVIAYIVGYQMGKLDCMAQP
jgi:hypothetical protein